MSLVTRHFWRWVPVAAIACSVLGVRTAAAQFSPPSTVFGSVTDAAGPVPADLPVTAYIGDTICGTKGKTEFTGDGPARVTVYFVDVLHESQTPGCGKDGAEVRIKIGDRFAQQTTRWKAGPVQMDVTFGNVTPAPIPTFTPAPPTPTNAPGASGTNAPGASGTVQPVGTIPAGSPGAGSPVPTLKGGVTSSTPAAQASTSDDGGGFPVVGVVLLVLAGIAAIGGGVGYAMSRNRGQGPDDPLLPPD